MNRIMQNQVLKIFVVDISKEGLAGSSAWWHDTDYRIVLCHLHRLYSLVSTTPKAKPSVEMTAKKLLRPVLAWCDSVILH